jgi:diguanylate cyclase (GGDEF)-like protein
MDFHPFSVYVLLCGGMSIAIAYYAWRRPAAFGARALSAFMPALSIYIVGYTMELASPDLAGQLLQVALRMRMNAVLFYIDLDGLKRINDVLGHAAGDRALIEAGDLLKQSFRESDVTARLGGDEFVVLAAESGKGSRPAMLARMKEDLRVRNAQPGRAYRLLLSIGAALFEWRYPDTLDGLLETADQAMYKV